MDGNVHSKCVYLDNSVLVVTYETLTFTFKMNSIQGAGQQLL